MSGRLEGKVALITGTAGAWAAWRQVSSPPKGRWWWVVLASDEAAFINATDVMIDGGQRGGN